MSERVSRIARKLAVGMSTIFLISSVLVLVGSVALVSQTPRVTVQAMSQQEFITEVSNGQITAVYQTASSDLAGYILVQESNGRAAALFGLSTRDSRDVITNAGLKGLLVEQPTSAMVALETQVTNDDAAARGVTEGRIVVFLLILSPLLIAGFLSTIWLDRLDKRKEKLVQTGLNPV